MTNSEQVSCEIRALGLSPGALNIPTPIPVVETNPRLARYANIVRAIQTNTDGTIYTTPTKGQFYLCSAFISRAHLVTDTDGNDFIRAIIGGRTVEILALAGTTLTLDSSHLAISFNFPIPIDKGTNIITAKSNNTTFLVGGITGYLEDEIF